MDHPIGVAPTEREAVEAPALTATPSYPADERCAARGADARCVIYAL